jgi:hypothetical protein
MRLAIALAICTVSGLTLKGCRLSISVELTSEVVAAIIGRKEFNDPVRRSQLIQALCEVHSTLRDLRAKCQNSRVPGRAADKNQNKTQAKDS